MFQIYILSSGVAQEHEYCWYRIEEEDRQVREIPPVFPKLLKVEDYIDPQKPSILLSRVQGKYLFLLITALKTGSQRVDFMGRSIRNSIALLGEDSSDHERVMKDLTIRALNYELDDPVNTAVDNDLNYGFKASFAKLMQLTTTKYELLGQEPDSVSRYAVNDSNYRQELIHDLKRYKLPKTQNPVNPAEILVLVTSVKTQKGLENDSIWRCLSDRMTGVIEQDYPTRSSLTTSEDKKKLFPLLIFLIGLFAVMLIVLVGYLLQRGTQELTPPLENEQPIEQSAPLQNNQIDTNLKTTASLKKETLIEESVSPQDNQSTLRSLSFRF